MKQINISNYTDLLNEIKEECIQNPWKKVTKTGDPIKDYKSVLDNLTEEFKQKHENNSHVILSSRTVYRRLSLIGKLETKLKQDLQCKGVISSGIFLYKKGGYCDWHNDNRKYTSRLYFSFASKDKESFFATYDDKLKVDYDKKGWQYRTFNVPMWHCVGSNCNRFSLGFNIIE